MRPPPTARIPQSVLSRRILALAAGICSYFLTIPTLATPANVLSDEDGAAETTSVPDAPDPGISSSEVDVRVSQFGLGNQARAGDWAGIRIGVLDNQPRARDVVVRIAIPDNTGDLTLYERVPVTAPGEWREIWLYARIPYTLDRASSIRVTVHEAIETDSGGAASAGGAGTGDSTRRFRAGRIIGATRYPPNAIVPPHISLTAVVGDRLSGIEQYSTFRAPGYNRTDEGPPRGHELIETIKGIKVEDIPDRWMGLSHFDTLLWTSASQRVTALSEDQARAIEEWIRRGGHFIVVMPPTAQPWIGAASQGNLLAPIMPRVDARRIDGVDLNDYRRLLTRDKTVKLPPTSTLHAFTPSSDADAFSAMPLMTGPGGEIVVVRRLLGAGAVTLIGLDIANPQVGEVPGAIQADLFWNNLLGRRTAVDSPGEIARNLNATSNNYMLGRGTGTDIDRGIHTAIRLAGQTATGLLLALVVFGLYWLIAGPGGFFALKSRGKKHWAWPAFAATTALFTLIAWGGASTLKGQRVQIRHITMLDHVYGQDAQRARAFANLYIPSYGDVRVSAASDDPSVHNLVAAWESEGTSLSQSFPDARGYRVEARDPDSAAFPSRATSRMVQVDWMGTVPDGWVLPHPVIDASTGDVTLGGEIRLVPRKALRGEREWQLIGSIEHGLPVPLKDAYVIVNLQPLGWFGKGTMPFEAYVARIDEWPSDLELDLRDPVGLTAKRVFPLDRQTLRRDYRLESFLESRGAMTPPMNIGLDESTGDLLDASFMPLFPDKRSSSQSNPPWLRRNSTHSYDIGRWFTQPCIIVIGRLENAALPVEMTYGGDKAPPAGQRNRGDVIVRWMYPLPPMPISAAGASEESTDSAAPAGDRENPGEAPLPGEGDDSNPDDEPVG